MYDNFFALGGDSIRSIQIQARARELGVSLDSRSCSEHQTIAELADHASGSVGVEAESVAPFALISAADRALLPDDVEDAYPLTSMQAGMLFHTRRRSASDPVYHNLDSFVIRGVVEPAAFRRALAQVASPYVVFRTTYDLSTYSEPAALVHRELAPPSLVRASRPGCDEQGGDAGRVDQARETAGLRGARAALPPCDQRARRRRVPPRCRFASLDPRPIESSHPRRGAPGSVLSGARATRGAWPLPDSDAATVREFVYRERTAVASEATRHFWEDEVDGHSSNSRRGRPKASGASHEVSATRSAYPRDCRTTFASARRFEPRSRSSSGAHGGHASPLRAQRREHLPMVTHGRPARVDADHALGLFLNTLPLRLVPGSLLG